MCPRSGITLSYLLGALRCGHPFGVGFLTGSQGVASAGTSPAPSSALNGGAIAGGVIGALAAVIAGLPSQRALSPHT